jgi:hypothetical protein
MKPSRIGPASNLGLSFAFTGSFSASVDLKSLGSTLAPLLREVFALSRTVGRSDQIRRKSMALPPDGSAYRYCSWTFPFAICRSV